MCGQYISITSTIAAMLGEVAIINLLTYYIGRRKVLFNEYALLPKLQYGSDPDYRAFVQVADFVQPVFILFLVLR